MRFKQQTPAGEILKELPPDDDNDPTRPGDARGTRSSSSASRRPTKARSSAMPSRPTIAARTCPITSSRRRAPRSGCSFPLAGKFKSEGGFDTFTVVGYFKSGMSEYDSTHVYVPLERLARAAQADRRERPRRGQSDPDQGQARRCARPSWPRRFRYALDELHPAFFRVYTWEAEARAPSGGRRHRAEHPQHPALLHHRRGRVRHPGDLFDDRRREDPRHRRHEGPGGVDRRHPWHLSRLRSLAGRRRQRRRDGWRAALCTLHQRDRAGLEHRHAPPGVRRHDLLLRQDSHDRAAVHAFSGSWPVPS